MSKQKWVYRGAVCALLLSGGYGCGKKDRFANVDSKMRDAGADMDAGGAGSSSGSGGRSGSGAGGRSGSGASDRDAAMSGDASGDSSVEPGEDGGQEPGEAPNCQLADEESELSQPVEGSSESGFAIARGVTGFGVVFQAKTEACPALGMLPVPSTGAYPKPEFKYGDCKPPVYDVSLLHVGGGYRMSWVDTIYDTAELETVVLPDTLSFADAPAPTRVTHDDLTETSPTLAAIGGHDYLSWIASDPAKRPRAIMLQEGDASTDARTLIAADAGYIPTRIALAALGADRGALAFVSEQGKPGIWLQPLDSDAKPDGELLLMSSAVSADNTVDLATREEDGGAIVYSLDFAGSYEVRFRRLDANGKAISEETKIGPGTFPARDAGVARLGGGYAVAFRALATEADPRDQIRLAFISKEGNVQRDGAGRLISYHVTDASPSGGRVSVRISVDGQLLIGFVDAAISGSKLRLIRKRLDCAL